MKNALFIILILLISSSLMFGQTRVIFDTDIDSDVDDVLALALLHSYEKSGLIKTLGVIVTSNDSCSFSCTDAINTFYGRPDILVGYLKKQNNITSFSKYTCQVSREFPHKLKDISQTTESVELYRKLLAENPDGSVVIVTVGGLTSLQDLLMSKSDTISRLNGEQLVRRKVKKWICMGGQIPKGKEANFYRPDPLSTVYCIKHFRHEVVFVDVEIGLKILTGGTYLKDNLKKNNPVYMSFELYNNFAGRASWDQLAVMLLNEKSKEFFDIISDGYMTVSNDGSNEWIVGKSKNKNHSYIAIRTGVDPKTIGKYIDDQAISME
jgi:inosine-uridine nucleoside N-ribohydrolase